MNLIVKTLPYSRDNYAYLILAENEGAPFSILIDPGEPQLTDNIASFSNYPLTAVLITHSHSDHIAGLGHIRKNFPQAKIFAHPLIIAGLGDKNHSELKDGVKFSINGLEFDVFECVSHASDHFVYKINEHLFVGDVLFSAGCGRFFSGSGADFKKFSDKLLQMDDSLKIYFGHEYTLSNLMFAASIEPENTQLQKELQNARLMGTNFCSTPTTLEKEKLINPFLRYKEEALRPFAEAQNIFFEDKVGIIKALRSAKDNF